MTEAPRTTSFDNRLSFVSVVAVGVLVASLCWFKLSSLDTGFHVAYGRQFLDTGRIVTTDPFLVPSIVQPFINGNWGTQVVMALVERIGGATGLLVLRWALIAVVFLSMAVIVRWFTPEWSWVAWCWLVAALASYERFALRPELFGYAFMSLMLVVLIRGLRNWRGIVILGVLQAFWTNFSYYFLVGVMLTGSMLAGELMFKVAVRRKPAVGAKPPSKAKLLGVAMLIQMAACVMNPWHVRGALHPLATLRNLEEQKVLSLAGDQTGGGAWAVIDEFRQPFRFLGSRPNYRTIDAYLVLLAVGFVGLIVLFVRRRWSEGLAIALFLVMSVQMRRNIAQFAFVAAPLTAGALATVMPVSWSRHRSVLWLRRGLVTATIVAALGWAWSVIDGRFYYVEHRINREPGMGYSARVNLINAARWLSAQNAVHVPVFVDLYSSSNVLPWLGGRLKTLVNTNTFAYPDAWLRDVVEVGAGRIDHRAFFDRHGVGAALLHVAPDTESLVRALRADPDWALVYLDPHALIFLRRTPEQLSVVNAHRPSPDDIDVDAWIRSEGGFRYHRCLSIATMGAVPWVLGWYAPAARLFEEAVRLAPDSAATWNYLGLCHGHLAAAARDAGNTEAVRSQLREAIRCFERLVAIQPGNEGARQNLAGAQEALQSVR